MLACSDSVAFTAVKISEKRCLKTIQKKKSFSKSLFSLGLNLKTII